MLQFFTALVKYTCALKPQLFLRTFSMLLFFYNGVAALQLRSWKHAQSLTHVKYERHARNVVVYYVRVTCDTNLLLHAASIGGSIVVVVILVWVLVLILPQLMGIVRVILLLLVLPLVVLRMTHGDVCVFKYTINVKSREIYRRRHLYNLTLWCTQFINANLRSKVYCLRVQSYINHQMINVFPISMHIQKTHLLRPRTTIGS